VHCDPDKALSDGMQSLYPEQFDELMSQVRQIAAVLKRTVPAIGLHERVPAGSASPKRVSASGL
jgi:3-deoxy-7-phosphoheptulonate synthase